MAAYSDQRLHDAFAAVKGKDLLDEPLQIRAYGIPKKHLWWGIVGTTSLNLDSPCEENILLGVVI